MIYGYSLFVYLLIIVLYLYVFGLYLSHYCHAA